MTTKMSQKTLDKINRMTKEKRKVIDADVLQLVLKKEWYDMIESGVKKEEYREIKEYWNQRLEGKSYKKICFHYGYTKRNMTYLCEGIEKGIGNPEWGAPEGKEMFIIKIGKRIRKI